jgi:repressor LexA
LTERHSQVPEDESVKGKRIDVDQMNGLIAGQSIARVETTDQGIAIHLSNESVFEIGHAADGITLKLYSPPRRNGRSSRHAPTARQREYLTFIARFMAHHGIAPAESDIQRHFMVSAPSVHQMIVTLERRGFIARDRDLFGWVVPRSIRVLVDVP